MSLARGLIGTIAGTATLALGGLFAYQEFNQHAPLSLRAFAVLLVLLTISGVGWIILTILINRVQFRRQIEQILMAQKLAQLNDAAQRQPERPKR